jgi:hypothetical protein
MLSKRTVAPVLFVDGRVQTDGLWEHLCRNPRNYAEPTAERNWYKEVGE